MIVVIGMIVAFALFVTAHVAITYGLAFRQPRWRAPVGFLVAPLAAYWAWRERMKVRTGIWLGALVIYVVAIMIAKF